MNEAEFNRRIEILRLTAAKLKMRAPNAGDLEYLLAKTQAGGIELCIEIMTLDIQTVSH